VGRELYCLNCGASALKKLPNNAPVGDFVCPSCDDEYELKAKSGKLSERVPDGAYQTMLERLAALNNPNLIVLSYDKTRKEVTNLAVAPKFFFVPAMIEARPPLAPTARRAGWIGCNINLKNVPEAGRIFVVKNGALVSKELVLERWNQTRFLRRGGVEARGWLLEVLRCVEQFGSAEFTLAEMYAFEDRLSRTYPENQHVREKIRQQLQVLRDHGLVDFLGRGLYRRSR